MRVKLNPKETIESLYDENELIDLSIMESIYTIRTLKALVESVENGFIEVSKQNDSGQVYSEKYQIWLSYFDKL